jgi:hypothetical protein
MSDSIPNEERAGMPLKGGWPLEKWPDDTVADLTRIPWLPDDWGQGVKMIVRRADSINGGTLVCFISPDGRRYSHKHMVEHWMGRKVTYADGWNGQIQKALQQAKQNAGDTDGSDEELLKLLSAQEKRHLRPVKDFHFAIISARRASSNEGVKDIARVEAMCRRGGVTPTHEVILKWRGVSVEEECDDAEPEEQTAKAKPGRKPARQQAPHEITTRTRAAKQKRAS